MQYIVHFFDKLEDKIRNQLSHWAIIYAFVGGTLTVMFWRGIWHSADLLEASGGFWSQFLFSPVVSMVLSAALLLLTGLFVSVFIGDRILLSGIKHEKKLFEKTEEEVKSEVDIVSHLKSKINVLENDIKEIKQILLKK
ncbi:MAG: hypothetical protein WCW14_01575 [Candidatus Paceibacterota bacterium]|jgi:hypothetical protein